MRFLILLLLSAAHVFGQCSGYYQIRFVGSACPGNPNAAIWEMAHPKGATWVPLSPTYTINFGTRHSFGNAWTNQNILSTGQPTGPLTVHVEVDFAYPEVCTVHGAGWTNGHFVVTNQNLSCAQSLLTDYVAVPSNAQTVNDSGEIIYAIGGVIGGDLQLGSFAAPNWNNHLGPEYLSYHFPNKTSSPKPGITLPPPIKPPGPGDNAWAATVLFDPDTTLGVAATSDPSQPGTAWTVVTNTTTDDDGAATVYLPFSIGSSRQFYRLVYTNSP